MHSFTNIAFGHASAETERNQDPGLLLEGYVDSKAAIHHALEGHQYLFLGYKGAGKSAIAERIELTLLDDFDKFVTVVSLQDFPFQPFSRLVRGSDAAETKYPTAWSWILLVYILESFAKDESITHADPAALRDSITAFRQMGLSPAANPASIVRGSANKNFKLALPGRLAELSWSGSATKPASEIPDFVESLKKLLTGVKSQSRHYIIIDGLDDILTSREMQRTSLSALIFEVSRLNSIFARNDSPAKIILLCRTDLFEALPGPNNNKIRQDYAIELDWYHDPREPHSSELIRIAQMRTKRSLGQNTDLFKHFFPRFVGARRIEMELLDMTRHTPRDFLRLLFHIQQFAPTAGMLRSATIKSGMRDYSIKYFLPEIRDELSGYADPQETSLIMDSLGQMRRREFKLAELIDSSRSLSLPLTEEKIGDVCRLLFQCSALGNVQSRGGTTYFTFKYRNRHSTFNEAETIVLHRGLWKALNLI